jgi:hypothetical protein
MKDMIYYLLLLAGAGDKKLFCPSLCSAKDDNDGSSDLS